MWESTKDKLFAKLLSDQTGETRIKIFSLAKDDGTYTYCFLGGPYFGGEGGMLIKSIEKLAGDDNYLVYSATCKDPKDRIVTMIFLYNNDVLVDATMVWDDGCVSFGN